MGRSPIALEVRRDRHVRAAHGRVALAADGDDLELAAVTPMISSSAKRMMLVLSEPARPRSVVNSTIRRVPPSRCASSGWSSPPRTAATSARTSSSLSLYGRAWSVASWARFSFEAATNCIARVICLMLRTEPMRRRISR